MAILNKEATCQVQKRARLTKEDIGVPTNFVHTLRYDDLKAIEVIVTNQQNPQTNDHKQVQKITKEDIGPPENFVHTLHVGLDTDKNFSMDLEDCPDELKDVLKNADVEDQEKALKLDKATRLFKF